MILKNSQKFAHAYNLLAQNPDLTLIKCLFSWFSSCSPTRSTFLTSNALHSHWVPEWSTTQIPYLVPTELFSCIICIPHQWGVLVSDAMQECCFLWWTQGDVSIEYNIHWWWGKRWRYLTIRTVSVVVFLWNEPCHATLSLWLGWMSCSWLQ